MSAEQRVSRLEDALLRFRSYIAANPAAPVSELLPLVFTLRGAAYSLKDHFPHEPLFKIIQPPRKILIKSGRQVAKSTGVAAASILRSIIIPYYNQMTITPLQNQVQRFSNNYVRPFLIGSSVRSQILNPGTANSVLQRTLANGSNLFYNYAGDSADRVRGIALDDLTVDELQDFDLDVLPVVEQCLSASKWKIKRYCGTPKSFDNTIQVYWEQSSQAEWHIPCQVMGCKRLNRCAVKGDLLKMFWETPAFVCAGCGNPVDSRLGFWVHDFPDRQVQFPGYHMPQCIFPRHYEKPMDWDNLQQHIRDKKPKRIIYNEVLGESEDSGAKMITMEQLRKAAILPVHTPRQFKAASYLASGVGVDWGGKGKEKATDSEEMISNTACSLGGMRSDGIIEIRFLKRTPYEADPSEEAEIVREILADSKAKICAHDFGGAGNLRESMLIQTGFPVSRVIPFTYASGALNKKIVTYIPPGIKGARKSWTLDKARSLLLFFEMIKVGLVLLPDWDMCKSELDDFFSVYEETRDSVRGGGRQYVQRIPRKTDDVVHSCNLLTMALMHVTGKWPALAAAYENLNTEDERGWSAADL